MSEIERAIQEFEDNAFHPSLKPEISEESKAVALRVLRAELDREKNEPLTWNERINQMTVEEKARYLSRVTITCPPNAAKRKTPCKPHGCEDCWTEYLASPYTKGEKV